MSHFNSFVMYSEPVIVTAKRSYVKVYVDGKRFRFYNGKLLALKCNPNKCTSLTDKTRALQSLQYHLKKKLESGWKPGTQSIQEDESVLVSKSVEDAFQTMESDSLSKIYMREVKATKKEFLQFLMQKFPSLLVSEVQTKHLKEFLASYKYSSSLFLNRRSNIGALFSRIEQAELIQFNPVYKVPKTKAVPVLHKPYTKQQLHQVLETLKDVNLSLYICAIIMYGCLLRPHREIRLLTRSDFNEDLSVIALGGKNNKGKRIRSVLVPRYVRDVLIENKIHLLQSDENIFTKGTRSFGSFYFNTAWQRIAENLIADKVIYDQHTLYSFRHTAAINVYQKTKDPYKLQKMMGHSSLAVTLTYLRNLGLIVNADNEDDLPEI
jgi:integrase